MDALGHWLVRGACLTVGVGLGFALAHRAPPLAPLAPLAPPAPPASAAAPAADEPAPAFDGANGTCAPVVAQLQREIARLRSAPAAPVDARAPDPLAPRPLPRPADLPERFTQQPMMQALLAALKEAGIEGDITSIDCTEYPCVAVGRIGKGDFKKLYETQALAAYKDDAHPYLVYNVDGDERPVAFSFMPRDTFRADPNAPDADDKRAAWEAEQRAATNRIDMRMKEGLSGQPAGPNGETYR